MVLKRDLSANPRALPMTGVISALPVDHRVGGSLENLILKISSRVNDRRCLWGKLLIDEFIAIIDD